MTGTGRTGTGGTNRRTVLRSLLLGGAATVTAPVAAGCGTDGQRPQAAVVWSGAELAAFREVLAGYPDHPVDAVSAGDSIDAFLRARQRTGARPDIAVLPRPGLVTEYARQGWLTPLSGALQDLGAPWRDLVEYDGAVYGIWVKAAHKSLCWYLPDQQLAAAPADWEALVGIVRELAADPAAPAPLALGAADGWVLTDWFENVLAQVAGRDFEDALVAGDAAWTDPEVTQALRHLAQVWSVKDAFPGGARRALLCQFEESVMQVVTGQAALLIGADFVSGTAASYGLSATGPHRSLRSGPFPPLDPQREPTVVVGGDVAVVFAGSPSGADLAAWLADSEVFRPWAALGGYLSPDPTLGLARYPSGQTRRLARQIHFSDRRFDLSDRLPGLFTGADGVGIWRILQEFFTAVTTGEAPNEQMIKDAIDRATRQLARSAQAAVDGGGL